jgi:hypothetical protein
MHLEDFATGREEVKVFCGSHIPPKKERKDGILWKIKKRKSNTRIFVACLTENARRHWEGNCYNGEDSLLEVFGRDVVHVERKEGE